MTNYKELRALCDAAAKAWIDVSKHADEAAFDEEFCKMYDVIFKAAPALIDEVEKYEKALKFILENSDETLANNVAFKALKGTGHE